MPLRNSQTVMEVYSSGGESHRNTQTMMEVYLTGGGATRYTQTVMEVYSSVAESPAGAAAGALAFGWVG